MTRYLFVDSRITEQEYSSLSQYNSNIIKVPPCDLLYPAVCGHPDILLHILDHKTIMVHKDMDNDFVKLLRSYNFNVIHSAESLTDKYPQDIILNAVSSENFFLHHTKYTDSKLMNIMNVRKSQNNDFSILDIPQGYAKCSLAVLGNNCFITSDKPIYKKLFNYGSNILYVPPGDIVLPGLDYGFIGGCCGMIDEHRAAFYGDLNQYEYGEDVINFLKICDIDAVFLSGEKLIDRGSILHCDI